MTLFKNTNLFQNLILLLLLLFVVSYSCNQPSPPTIIDDTENGFIENSSEIVLTVSDSDLEIYYTLDNTPPEPNSGNKYTKPLEISNPGTIVLRCVSYKEACITNGTSQEKIKYYTVYKPLGKITVSPKDETQFEDSQLITITSQTEDSYIDIWFGNNEETKTRYILPFTITSTTILTVQESKPYYLPTSEQTFHFIHNPTQNNNETPKEENNELAISLSVSLAISLTLIIIILTLIWKKRKHKISLKNSKLKVPPSQKNCLVHRSKKKWDGLIH
ncbi:t-cell immunoglobulin and mucin domain-containing protein [Anaeramoeba flamelloides]|uniref:T-cell immunoglobulin and mucin domain-containing protein n=1 Tax=Anaeramoeba flamelloides TaxID=1746091 RepID=A0AAV7YNB9_9EUKA|nr:t-cell immunoglobulin and mucin domain-containing protein [Anaeramoeba flamelloides]